jgi:hypothetical protein
MREAKRTCHGSTSWRCTSHVSSTAVRVATLACTVVAQWHDRNNLHCARTARRLRRRSSSACGTGRTIGFLDGCTGMCGRGCGSFQQSSAAPDAYWVLMRMNDHRHWRLPIRVDALRRFRSALWTILVTNEAIMQLLGEHLIKQICSNSVHFHTSRGNWRKRFNDCHFEIDGDRLRILGSLYEFEKDA